YINCNCYLHPVGLRHGISEHLHPVGLHHELKPLDLPFGSNFTLSLRDELFDMEVVSRIFEEDIDIVNEVQRHIKNGSDMALPSTLYLLAKDGYNPHCDIDFEEGCNLKHSVPEILVTHDDNSSKDIAKEMDEASLVIDEAPQSNIHAEVKSTCYSDDSDSELMHALISLSIADGAERNNAHDIKFDAFEAQVEDAKVENYQVDESEVDEVVVSDPQVDKSDVDDA
ncbi:hypothetical protein Tco_0032336, partial [Tanacetum coccineum]